MPRGFGGMDMAQSELLQGFQSRLALYGLDDRARRVLAETWKIVAPNLERAIDDIIASTKDLPHVGEIIARHNALIRKLEVSHFEALLGGGLDAHYAESRRETVQQEAALGLDGRMRSTAGNF